MISLLETKTTIQYHIILRACVKRDLDIYYHCPSYSRVHSMEKYDGEETGLPQY